MRNLNFLASDTALNERFSHCYLCLS